MMPRTRPQAALGRGRRGTVYIAVLGISLLVATIGLSGLLAMRIEQRAVASAEAAVKADTYAQSALDLTLFWLSQNPIWRTTYTHNVWTSELPVGDARISFKLVDEQDGNLANDPTQPVRLYAKAAVGDAVRLYSVRLQQVAAINLLTNGGVEGGTTGWSGAFCLVESRADQPHGGAAALRAYSRVGPWAGPDQTVTSILKNGTTYVCEFWARLEAGSDFVQAEIETVGSASGSRVFQGSWTLVGTSWTKVTTTLTPTWSGTLSAATLNLDTQNVATTFRIDDVVLFEQYSGPPLVPVPGTLRQDVLP